MNKHTVVLFGASQRGLEVLQRIQNHYHVMGFVDNDQQKQGRRFAELPVYAPEMLLELRPDFILVSSMYSPDIVRQLRGLGIADDKIRQPGETQVFPVYDLDACQNLIPYTYAVQSVLNHAHQYAEDTVCHAQIINAALSGRISEVAAQLIDRLLRCPDDPMLEGTAARVIGILEQDQGIDVLDPSVNAQWSQLAALWRRHFNSSLQGNYPLVSVVVPVYKVEPYLSQCLDSLVNQTLLNIEIVVVDDDSPDQSFGIVEQYRCAHPSKVKYFHKPNGGLSSARNYGMQQATGLYIGFVDGDDYVETGMFANLFDCIHLQQLQVACAQYYHYPISGGITLGGELLLDGHQIYHGRDFLRNAHVMVVCNKLYRRPFIQDMPFPSMWFEDIAWTPVIMSRAERVGYIPMPLYHYVQRAGSIVSSQGDPRTLQGIDAIKYALHHALPTERDVVVYMAIKRLLFETKRRPEYTDYYLAALKQLANEALECQHIKSNPELAFWLTSIHVNKKCK